MVNVNPNRESCMEYMKELIRKGLSRTEIVEECRKKIDNVHPNTFYDWYDIVIVESDIEEWEKDNRYLVRNVLFDIRSIYLLAFSPPQILEYLRPNLFGHFQF